MAADCCGDIHRVVVINGREITIDMSRVKVREYRALTRPDCPIEEEDKVMSLVSGLSIDEIGDLSWLDYRALWAEFFERARNPLAVPNSPSAST